MKKSFRVYTIRHYAVVIRRNALRCALGFLALYLVCDYLAQIRPLTLGTLSQSCQKDMNALMARLPYIEPDYQNSPVLHPTNAPAGAADFPSTPSLFKKKLNAPDVNTQQYLKDHVDKQR